MTRDEAKELVATSKSNPPIKLSMAYVPDVETIIDELYDTYEAEKREIARVLKGFDNVPKADWEKHINELIEILEDKNV